MLLYTSPTKNPLSQQDLCDTLATFRCAAPPDSTSVAGIISRPFLNTRFSSNSLPFNFQLDTPKF
jgi:hypothetical protein